MQEHVLLQSGLPEAALVFFGVLFDDRVVFGSPPAFSRKNHKKECALMALSLLTLAEAARAPPFVEALKVPTRGAAGWTHFVIDGQDYVCVANFFSSRPGKRPSMETDSTVYAADVVAGSLKLTFLQGFKTTGAHGVVHLSRRGGHYLVVPNYYGGDAVVLRWDGKKFRVMQHLIVDGGGNVVEFTIGDEQMISIAEFNQGRAAIYALRGDAPNERFELWQNVRLFFCVCVAHRRGDARS